MFTNKFNVFGSSVEHICNGTFCHEGRMYKFFFGSNGKNTIRSLNEWGNLPFELIINPYFGDFNLYNTSGTLYVKDKESQKYTFTVEKK